MVTTQREFGVRFAESAFIEHEGSRISFVRNVGEDVWDLENSGNLLSEMMNMLSPSAWFTAANNTLLSSVSKVSEESMLKADVGAVKMLNLLIMILIKNGKRNITRHVSEIDGSSGGMEAAGADPVGGVCVEECELPPPGPARGCGT
ncbi:Protein of unknown function [Gryllus bimaculatus]|nr:Protein of unknown function [Gryllus bimaculatus]